MLSEIFKFENVTPYDLAVIVFYFIFMFSIGFVFKAFNKDDSDYFRGGGSMLWWMVGATAFMTQFSAWTFTGAASKAYHAGTLVAMIFMGNALGYLINYLWASYRFRRMRTVTPIEGVRDRYSKNNEQVFTWMQMPMSLVYAGIWLNGLAIFMAAVFGVTPQTTIIVVGFVVLFMSVTGGSWAVVASDFVQVLILMSISILMAFLALNHEAIGGIGGLINKAPERHFNWSIVEKPDIIYFWAITALIIQSLKLNNMFDAYRYLCVKDDKQARKAALMAAILMFFGPVIWFIPPIAASIIQPDIASEFPLLEAKKAAEASYVFMGIETLPKGMLGLLLCGIFAATMSSMDSGLNRNAGIFVKNFYQPILAPKASKNKLLLIGKITSCIFGVLVILTALFINELKDLDLFNIMLLFGSLIAIPYAMPLVLGMIIKKSPPWSGWSTVLVGFSMSLLITIFVQGLKIGDNQVLEGFINPAWFGYDDFTGGEKKDIVYILSVFNAVICTLWFLGTTFFYNNSSDDYKQRVEEFFNRIQTPIDTKKEQIAQTDTRQSNTLAYLCFVYGGFIFLLAVVVPNSIGGRLAFIFCGGLIAGVGCLLKLSVKNGSDTQKLNDTNAETPE